MYDFRNDPFGRECILEAEKCRSDLRFGAILVKDEEIIGRGWNRRSTAQERKALTHVDYAIHGEQACVLDALQHGKDVYGGVVYVLGYSHAPASRGRLTVRDGAYFTCRKCPYTFRAYNLTVCIPHEELGWVELTAEEALSSAREHMGHWQRFVAGK